MTILVLVILGFILLAVELFVPGMIVGILGGVLLFIAVILSFGEYGLGGGGLIFAGISFVVMIGFAFWLRYFPKSYIGKKLTLQTAIKGPGEYPELTSLIGKTGTALTTLRPAGTALIEGKRIDVVTLGEMIVQDAAISVIQVEGAKVVVKPI